MIRLPARGDACPAKLTPEDESVCSLEFGSGRDWLRQRLAVAPSEPQQPRKTDPSQRNAADASRSETPIVLKLIL